MLLTWRVITIRHRFHSNIASIREGMTQAEVIDILGKPEEVRKPCYARRVSCDQDFVYSTPFEFAGFWTVSLDRSGRVIDTFHWQSP